MSASQVHYEVFTRARRDAPWTLQYATEDRAKALETAEEAIVTGHALGVRVFKETFDEDTREFRSLSIFSKGQTGAAPKSRVESGDAAACVSPHDLYTVHARDRIGRLLDGWLRRRGVTAFELLHRGDLAEDLDASGSDLQHAIQRVSIPEAQARGVSTHEVIRAFQKLAERAIERVEKDARAGRFPAAAPAGFAALCRETLKVEEPGYVLGGAVAAYLADAAGWTEKVSRILDLAEAAPETGPARGLALGVLEQPLSEILSAPSALAQLIGPDLDLGGSLAALTRLAAGDAVDQMVRFEPGLSAVFRPLPPAGDRLRRWLTEERFHLTRAALGRRILRELKGPKRLRPADADQEIQVMRALAMALTAATGQLLSADDLQEAFIERSRAILAGDFISAYLEGRDGALSEAGALLRLAENVAGAINKATAARWLLSSVTTLRFEREARDLAGATAAARLAQLAALQKGVRRIGLNETDADALSNAIGAVGAYVEADSRLASAVARSAAPAPQKLSALLRLACGETGPLGAVADRARAEALKLLKDGAVRGELAAAPEELDRIRRLVAAAGLAA